MATINLQKTGTVLGILDLLKARKLDTVDIDAGATAFSKNDLVAFVSARNAWGRVVAADGGTGTTLLSLALDNLHRDVFERPIGKPNVKEMGKQHYQKFRRLRLKGIEIVLNVNANQNIAASNINNSYGLLIDATTGIATVNLTNTTQQHFKITRLHDPSDPIEGGTYGDVQARVRGYLVDSRVDQFILFDWLYILIFQNLEEKKVS